MQFTVLPHIGLVQISTDLSVMYFSIPVGQMRLARTLAFRNLKKGIMNIGYFIILTMDFEKKKADRKERKPLDLYKIS